MQRTKKSLSRVLSMMLAVAMVLTLNLTSLNVKAATDIPKPVSQTEVTAPTGVTVKVGANTAKFYKDTYETIYDDGGLTFIRAEYSNTTELSALQNAKITITATSVTSSDSSISISKNSSGQFTFNADLRNKTYKLTIDTKDYILAASIKAGTSTPTASGYVVSATINGESAAITRFVKDNPCAGNPYYTQNEKKPIDWISITNYIQKENVKAPADAKETPLSYTIKGGATDTVNVDLTNGTVDVTIGKYTYTVKASFVAENVFVASPSTFWIDFQELRNSKDADATSLAQALAIENGVKAYYDAADTQKEFPVGTTNMKVLQTILQWCADNNYIKASETTLGESTTYVSKINGLGEFSVGSLSGWMYTDNPDSSIAPENWYTAPVGAADYQLAADSKIAWFYTVNYGTHPW